VCLQLYDIRCNSLIVGGIQLAMILHRTGSLLYQKMLPHGDALKENRRKVFAVLSPW
jgi:hypothetical protein